MSQAICNKKKYCDTIIGRNQRGGLELLSYLNFKSSPRGLKTTEIFVHKTSKKDKGLVLNFCPWCGFDFTTRSDWPKDI